jgi:hypothetical protein
MDVESEAMPPPEGNFVNRIPRHSHHFLNKHKTSVALTDVLCLAEREGFEPSQGLAPL